MLQPELAGALRDRKLANIEAVKPDCVAAGNIGCIDQLAHGPVPVVHTVELLDWAYGGPCRRRRPPKSACTRCRARARPWTPEAPPLPREGGNGYRHRRA